MVKKHLKRCYTSYFMREIAIKIMRYHYTFVCCLDECFLHRVLLAVGWFWVLYTSGCLLGATLGITDKMEARPQTPLLIPQAWTRMMKLG